MKGSAANTDLDGAKNSSCFLGTKTGFGDGKVAQLCVRQAGREAVREAQGGRKRAVATHPQFCR